MIGHDSELITVGTGCMHSHNNRCWMILQCCMHCLTEETDGLIMGTMVTDGFNAYPLVVVSSRMQSLIMDQYVVVQLFVMVAVFSRWQ